MFWKKKISVKNIFSIGSRGEDIAERFLKKKGYRILARNYKNSTGYCLGEIDIVAREEDTLVFVEVKTYKKTLRAHARPEEQITRAKLHKLNRVAQIYLAESNRKDAPYRFDAVSVLLDPHNEQKEVRHLKNIFL